LQTQEGSAYGAALLALVGTGEYANVRDVCAATVRETEVKQPDPAARAYYDLGYSVFQSLYPALRNSFAAIGTLDE
jgi:xylulokinase